MNVSFSVSAFNDLEDIVRYYREQGVPDIGTAFAEAIVKQVQMLARHPDSGRVVPEFEQVHIREIMHKPFRVVYQRDASAVTVIRVWRSERLLVLPE